MEGKGLNTVIMGVLILGLVLQQVQVEASSKICCRDENARKCFFVCLLKSSKIPCAHMCHCVLTSDQTCPSDYPNINLLLPNSEKPDAIEYCKLGCRSFVCGNMNTNVELKLALERCDDACGRFCDGYGSVASMAA